MEPLGVLCTLRAVDGLRPFGVCHERFDCVVYNNSNSYNNDMVVSLAHLNLSKPQRKFKVRS